MPSPVLDPIAWSLPDVAESDAQPQGLPVSVLFTDGIAITALDTSLGTWQYSVDGGASWLTIRADLIDSTTGELALLLGPAANLRLLPFADLNGTLTDAVTFRAWNQSSGSQGNYVQITSTGGSTAFSDQIGTASVMVTAVNDAPTFNLAIGGGVQLLPLGGGDQGLDVTVQPDGKIIVVGSATDIYYTFGVVRLNADGSLDASFNGGGKMVQMGYATSALGLAVQADGKIILVGNIGDVVRLNADGSLDTTFNGGSGKVSLPVDYLQDVTLQPDGKIVVAGYSYNGDNDDFVLMRLDANGALDTTFNGSGRAIVPVADGFEGSGLNDRAYGVTVQPDGKIIVAGDSFDGSTYDFALVRLNADGSLDSSFGGAGKALVPIGQGNDFGYSVTLQSDGKIIVAGNSVTPSTLHSDFALVRLNADGSLDSSFGGTGKTIVSIGQSFDVGRSVMLQPDGKIVVAGYSKVGVNDAFSVVRLNADGSLDTSFNGSGKVLVPSGYDAECYGLALQPDGKIVLVGDANSATSEFAVARLNADGSLDTTFNPTSVDTLGGTAAYTEGAAAVALDSSVAIHDAELAAAGNYAGASVTLARHGGASGDDLFSALGNLSFTGGHAALSGITIGTVDNSAGTLTITFDANATQARVNEALSSIGYANGSSAPEASVQVDWTFSDGNTGAQGTGGALTAGGSTTVNITSVNQAPVLDGGTVSLPGIAEGDTHPPGFSLGDLGSVYFDADGDGVGMAITALDTSLGSWQYSTDGGASWLTIDADLIDGTTGELALLLGPTAKLRLLPFGDSNGTLTEAVTFRAWDMTSGSEGDYVQITSTGGSTAFSDQTDTASITVTAVNDAPTFSLPNGSDTLGGTVAYTEGAAAVALDSSVVAYDVDLAAVGNYAGASVTLARHGGESGEDVFSALGNLSFAGADAVLSGAIIGTVSNSAGTLTITFNDNATQSRVDEVLSSIGYANASDVPQASVQIDWTFSDGNTGAQGPGGALTAAGTTTVDITATNDAPIVATPSSQTVVRDDVLVFSAANANAISVSDADAGDNLVQVTVTATHGTLALAATTGLSFIAGTGTGDTTMTFTGTIADIDADLNGMSFTPTARYLGAAAIQITADDQGGSGSGGAMTDTHTVSLTVQKAPPSPPADNPGSLIVGTPGEDTLTGTAGDDIIDGLAGRDVVTYGGVHGDYTVTHVASGFSIVGSDGVDTLVGIERISFGDGYALGLDLDGPSGEAFRLYLGALGRQPDLPGLGYQIDALDKGVPLATVAGNFLASPEFASRFGAPNDSDFVTLLYQQVLHRAPDAGGLQFHLNELASGQSRGEVLTHFTESPENQASVIGQIQDGILYVPLA